MSARRTPAKRYKLARYLLGLVEALYASSDPLSWYLTINLWTRCCTALYVSILGSVTVVRYGFPLTVWAYQSARCQDTVQVPQYLAAPGSTLRY